MNKIENIGDIKRQLREGREYQKKQDRLEYLRGELRAEKISYGDLAELQSLREYIGSDDVELLEAAGAEEN
jgi:hypothetical protein